MSVGEGHLVASLPVNSQRYERGVSDLLYFSYILLLGPAFCLVAGPSSLLNFAIYTLRALKPCDSHRWPYPLSSPLAISPSSFSTVRISISTLIFATFLCVFYLSFELLITIIKFFRYRWLPTERWLRTLSFEQRCSIIWLTLISFFCHILNKSKWFLVSTVWRKNTKKWSFGTDVSFQWEIMFFILFINKISNRFLYKYKYKINHVPQF